MKKFTILLFAMGITVGSFAQKSHYGTGTLPEGKELKTTEAASYDSKANAYVYPSTFQSCASLQSPKYPLVYVQGQPDPVGYATGSNYFEDQAFAQRYNQNLTVKGIGAYLNTSDGGTGTDLTAKMYAITNNTIGSEMASVNFNSANLTTPGITDFMFAAPQTSSSFALAISVPPYTQGVKVMAIGASTDGQTACATGSMSYTLLASSAGGTWETFTSTFQGTLDVDLFIFPIVESTGVNEMELSNLTYVYPVPASNEVVLASSVEMQKVEIYNLVGQRIFAENVSGISTKVNVSDYAPGQYIAKIYTEAGVVTKKMMVQ